MYPTLHSAKLVTLGFQLTHHPLPNTQSFVKRRCLEVFRIEDFLKTLLRRKITNHFTFTDLVGKQIVAVVNFPPKQIANFISECLVLGVYDEQKEVILLQPDKKTSNGWLIG
jgi:hypothetical protein